jgi:hypothetical protein
VSAEFGGERARLPLRWAGHNPVTTFTRMERPGTVNIYANVRAMARRADAVPNEQHSGRL